MKTALIIVDVQHFFLHNAPDDLVTNTARHIEEMNYDVIAFTVFRNTPNSNFVRSLNWAKCDSDEDTVLPEAFQDYVTDDNVFTRDTYSGFSGTDLDQYLRERGVKRVVLCGVDTDACVLATAFSAFDNGYLTDVNTDLTYSDGGLEEEAQAIIRRSILVQDRS